MIERRAWRFSDGLLLAGLTGLAILATLSTWKDIFAYALRDEEQSHILLAPAIALWLAWVRRERFRYTRPDWTILGPIVVVGGWGLARAGFESNYEGLWHLGALLIVCGAALTVLGVDFVRRFAPVALALLFLLPVPGRIRLAIAGPLQQITAAVTHWILELFGVPVTLNGNQLSINGHDVAIAEACNGMRMVAALGLVAFAFVFSTPMRQSVRVFILAISPLIAIVCNVIRLAPTVLLYGYSTAGVADSFHDISGWLMLPVALGMLWGVFSLLRWVEVPIAPYAVAEE